MNAATDRDPMSGSREAEVRSRSAAKLIWDSSVYAVGGFVPQALSIVLLPIFTRYLSPDDFGILSYTSVLCTFFTILGSLSIHTFLVRHYYECQSARAVKKLFGNVLLFILIYNVVLFQVAFLVLPRAFGRFGVQVPFTPYMELALLSTAIEVIGLIPLSYFRARAQAGTYVALAAAMAMLNGGISIYLVVGRGMGLLGRYYGQLGANVLLLAVYAVILSRIVEVSWSTAQVRRAAAFCLPLLPAQLAASFSSLSDRLILERFVPLSELGLYSVGAALATVPTILTTGVYSAIQPRVYQLASRGQLDGGMVVTKRYLLALMMVLMCVSVALSRDVVTLLAAPAFYDSYRIASLLVVSVLLQAFLTVVPSLYLVALGRTRYESPVRLASAMVGFASMLALVPVFGIYGAVIGATGSALTAMYGYHLALRKESAIEWGFGGDLIRMAAASGLGYAILHVSTPMPAVTAAIKLGLIAGAAGTYFLGAAETRRWLVASPK